MANVLFIWRSPMVIRELDIHHEKLLGCTNTVANKGSPKKEEPGGADDLRASLFL